MAAGLAIVAIGCPIAGGANVAGRIDGCGMGEACATLLCPRTGARGQANGETTGGP
jgi:hypothetical protein